MLNSLKKFDNFITKNNKFINFYNKNGFLVVRIFNKKEINTLKNIIKKKVDKIIHNKKWDLSDYHKYIGSKNNQKISKTSKRYINVSNKIIKKIQNNKKITNILLNKWKNSNFIIPNQKYLIGRDKSTTVKKIKKNEVAFRIVVPKKKNYSISAAPPPHVDLNAGKIIKKKKNLTPVCFTLWTPLIGFSKKYTLRFAPGSHLINHSIDKIEKNTNYISPVFKKKYYQKFKYKRLDLKKGEAILFDVNLIHGGTENLGSKSRVNLEFRLYNNKEINLTK